MILRRIIAHVKKQEWTANFEDDQMSAFSPKQTLSLYIHRSRYERAARLIRHSA